MKKTYIHHILFLSTFVFAGLIYGCTTVYFPTSTNVPLFDGEKEFKGVLTTGTSGYGIKSAYSLTTNVAVMLNGFYGDFETSRQSLGEIGLGYIFKYKKIPGFRTELFGGAGLSKTNSRTDEKNIIKELEEGKYYRLFIQVDVGYSSTPFEIAATNKIVYVNFYEYTHTLFAAPVHNQTDGLFFEPCVTMRVGSDNVKFEYQIGFAIPTVSGQKLFHYVPLVSNIGFFVSL